MVRLSSIQNVFLIFTYNQTKRIIFDIFLLIFDVRKAIWMEGKSLTICKNIVGKLSKKKGGLSG